MKCGEQLHHRATQSSGLSWDHRLSDYLHFAELLYGQGIQCRLINRLAAPFTNSLGMHMVPIASGSFVMGSEHGSWDERPRHEVTISQLFHISATEVTNAQYEQFRAEHKQLRGKLGFSEADDEAAIFVSWPDAVAFCRWLSDKEGRPYRLPTEAEWEYACRAGTTTAYHTGDALPPEYQQNAGVSWYPGKRTPHDVVSLRVGQTPPNAWGVYDMHGNVEEWCFDWYGPYEATGQTDPVGRAAGDFRVTRGGSHSTTPEFLRSSNRSGTLPEDKSWLIGLRVVQGESPATSPLPRPAPPLYARDVRQEVPKDLTSGPESDAARISAAHACMSENHRRATAGCSIVTTIARRS